MGRGLISTDPYQGRVDGGLVHVVALVVPVATAGRRRGGLVSHRRAGPGRCEAVPCCAGWHKQQAPISRQGGECDELSRPGQAPRPARGVDPTAKLEYDDIRARAISRADNDDDVQGINASIELIRRTRGGSWPTEPVSVDFDYVDEIWHECSSLRAARSPTPCTTPAASTPDAATCTRWDGVPPRPKNCSRTTSM